MRSFKQLTFVFLFFILASSVFGVGVFNEQGDFSVTVGEQRKVVDNENIYGEFSFVVKNNQDTRQTFEVAFEHLDGWDINLEDDSFSLAPGEEREIDLELEANSDFDYSTEVVSPDIVKISQNEQYIGFFEFPFLIQGSDENVSLKFAMTITNKENIPVEFEPKISTQSVSPETPLKYSITGTNIGDEQHVEVNVFLGEDLISSFQDTFTQEQSYKIYTEAIPVSYFPGTYEGRITVRLAMEGGRSAQEWYEVRNIQVASYEDLQVSETERNFLYKDQFTIVVRNNGNVPTTFDERVNAGFFSRIFFTSDSMYESSSEGIIFAEQLQPGEEKTIVYAFNYLPIYLILIFLIIVGSYMYYRKASNPLEVDTKIYEVKKVEHEGVKSMKIRIGFENIKEEEIENLNLIFRMPSYLQVKEDSFLLAPPKHAFRGRTQYKLIWEFKRFEKNDSRIIGFTLMNNRGVLGDIKLPNLELEVKVRGRVRRYYVAFPIIKG